MPVPLQQVLGAKNIINLIQKVKPGLAEDVLPPQFMTVTEQVSGNYGTFQRTVGERRTARVGNYGQPAVTYEPTGIEEVPVNFIHAFQDMPINPVAMMNLLDEGNENRQKIGMKTIGRNISDFAQIFKNLRVATIQMMLATGKIMTDGLGRLTMDSTKAARTIDFKVPAQNQGQLPIPRFTQAGKVTSAPIIDTAWSSASSDILQQITNLKIVARQLTGYPIKNAFCGANVKNYIFSNTLYKTYMNFQPQAQQALIQKDRIPDSWANLSWYEAGEAFFTQDLPNNGNPTNAAGQQANTGLTLSPNMAVPIFGPDTVVFTPDMSVPWYELIEGSFPIPTDAILAKDAMELMSSLEEAYGHFGFAKMGTDKQPSQIVQYQGDTFLPVITIPYSIFIATVKF